ncbi:hypothetical protein SAMN06265360_103115 [Haloechinothrix alba]|uniref:Nitroimidazol reductase NimA, pyridoxamine 5'-phosphate oxidase superfamily n=1 Tax=Haloechinothrix alba TaxID=664784 RepID=A0A238VMH9_9PSEU|nr:pyridoxamine 5'-phosphate oxidase family protein [Haloechinothrix alba]SNR35555.1 hypothetical protein SAMN06265360_103115 [Haloechinothrix alba]
MPDMPLSPTERSTPGRTAHRARTDRQTLYDILDAGFLCHMSLVRDGAPVTLPTCYGRDADTLYLHGSTGAHSLRAAASGVQLCVAVTHVDGIVYARSLVHHTLNYRSAIVHGTAHVVDDRDAKLAGLRVITDNITPGSWDYARETTRKELASVSVLAVPLDEASAKVRDEGPGDEDHDIADGTRWAGTLPLRWEFDAPVPATDLAGDVPVPRHVLRRPG